MKKTLEALAGVVYYLTADMQNGERAKDLTTAHGLRLEVRFPKDLPLWPAAAALVVDLDNLWLDAHGRRRWLAELRAKLPMMATFVHSYDFDDEEGGNAEHVVLARRLDDVLLRRLVAASNRAA